jgi:hypothetical protein
MIKLAESLKELPGIRSDSVTDEELEDWAVIFHKNTYEVFNVTVPVMESAQGVIKATSPNARHAHKQVLLRERDWKRSRTPELKKRLNQAKLAATELHLIERENAWNDYILRTIRNSGSYAKLYRQSKRKEQSKETAHMPAFKDTETSPEISDPEEQCDCLAKTLLGVSPATTRESCRLHLPFPDDPGLSCDPLEEDELLKLVGKMPESRASAEGTIPNRFVKLFKGILVPKLENFCKSPYPAISTLLNRDARSFSATMDKANVLNL